MRIVEQSVELLHITPGAAELIERAARTCYKSEGLIGIGTAVKLIKKMWDRGHQSPLEHAIAQFRVVCDRGVSHEFVRHRLMSFSQESTRYCNYTKEQFGTEITVIEPPELDEETRSMWARAIEHSEVVYCNLIARRVRPEIARSVLPNALKTEFVVTANLREWLHFCYLRNAPAAHPQMRQVAGWIEDALVRECPAVFKLMSHKRRQESAIKRLLTWVKGLKSLPDDAIVDADEGVAIYDDYVAADDDFLREAA